MAQRAIVGNPLRHVELTQDNWPKVSNVIAVWDARTKQEEITGTGWYHTYHQTIAGWARDYGYTLRQAVGVFAALSQRTSIDVNTVLAHTALQQGACPTETLAAVCVKVNRILAGEDPLDVLGGPKILAFFDNLLNPQTSERVTIDRHAIHAAIGEIVDDRGRSTWLKGTKRDAIENVFKQATREINKRDERALAYHQVQATVWETWRNLISAGGRS